ncbi:MAG: NAD(P)-dependent alcohol dehydrogenase [Myxococcaceae bacterium]|jgi:NADPH:quinone reductase-like Zn-dependent oxidoreductase|nr:NAD(P)-dependent alcohol dehydrogenase [Myxococcaceae bacterium]
MKAVVYREYGGPEVLQLAELSRPAVSPGQVLLQVAASSVNSADLRFLRADPFLLRLFNGLRRPQRRRVLGGDVAGVVVEVGAGVTRFRPGDRVFGETPVDRDGAFAEFCVAKESALAKVPDGVRLEDAAALPLAGTTALQGLRLAEVTVGQRVLIAGAGGGVGLFAVQLAKRLGAHVTAWCGPSSVALAKGLGADVVVDYATTPFDTRLGTFDAILGINGYQTLAAYRRRLVPGGRYVMVGGGSRQLFEALLFARPFFSLGGKVGRTLTIDSSQQAKDLERLGAWLAEGTLKVVVEQTYPLERLAEAVTRAEAGHVRGKLVITP